MMEDDVMRAAAPTLSGPSFHSLARIFDISKPIRGKIPFIPSISSEPPFPLPPASVLGGDHLLRRHYLSGYHHIIYTLTSHFHSAVMIVFHVADWDMEEFCLGFLLGELEVQPSLG
ncbi:uncharacterized protein [Coffea arabica]|uniref:Uncharacterized protein n=1 Tax=Coffea arabica TaxID=13443 RepID=A0ABM4W898_COFAR